MAEIKVNLDSLRPGNQKVLKSLTQANTYLALKFLKELCKEDVNVIFSPFSLSVSFAMLYSGAREKTALEMCEVLGYSVADMSDSEIHEYFKMILELFCQKDDIFVLEVANSIISQIDFPFLPEYQECVQVNYNALLKSVDFLKESKQAVLEINQWVKKKTRDKIQSVFQDLNPDTVMVLLNAIYFKGTWQYQFDPNNTRPGLFYNRGLDSGVKEITMMFVKKQFYFEERKDFKILVLPYKGNDVSMLLLLPKCREGIKDLVELVTSCAVNSFFENLIKTDVKVMLPKVHFEYTKNLETLLHTLGMKSLFSREANLQGLSGRDGLFVSQVVHKAVLDINEEGSEVAAVTAITLMRGMQMAPKPEFKAEHPFLFLIVDKNNMILFMGRVLEL